MPHRKRVFFVSDRTGITVEALGSSLLTQFAEMDFNRVTLPFIDSIDMLSSKMISAPTSSASSTIARFSVSTSMRAVKGRLHRTLATAARRSVT